jgi:general secretion pathway protein K
VKIESENAKVNLNSLDGVGATTSSAFLRAYSMLSEKSVESLWNSLDANKVQTNPSDLLIAIKDWVDPDKAGSAINLNSPVPSIVNGFSDENQGYSRYQPPYEAKNARFDSLDEAFMVHGMNDRIMANFRDRFTVYGDPNQPPTVNAEDPILLWATIQSVADPRVPDPRLKDPVFIQQIMTAIQTIQSIPGTTISAQNIVEIVKAFGVVVNASATSGTSAVTSDKDTTFTLTSTGEAGAIKKKVIAVVRMDQGGSMGGLNTAGLNTAGLNTAGLNTAGLNTQGLNTAGLNTGALSGALGMGGLNMGTLVYWREE